MEPHNSHLPPYIPNPWDPPPPPPPPPPFQWGGNPGFPNDGFPPPFHPFPPPPPPHHDPSFAAPPPNFCPPIPQFARKRKLDRADNDDYVKLYVVGVPRNVTQEEIYRLFEEYGNVVEVILLVDKQTGQQHEYCFVKYSLLEEADRAIKALHNQFVFPEAMLAIKVRYAEKGKQRQGLERSVQHDPCLPRPGVMQNNSTFSGPGEPLHKLYVNGLNKEASHQEIEEIFSSYGVVADIYIMRDERKQSRGCGFVGFSQKYMAVAAINGLHGSYVMKGCDNPLVVRFAEPKKPKNVDLRPALNSTDMQGSNMSNAQHMGNSSTSMQVSPIGMQAGSFPTVANRLDNSVTSEMQKQLQQPISPSRFSQMSLQHSQPWQGSPQSYRQTDSQLRTPLHSNQTSVSSIERQHDHQSPHTCRDTGSNSAVLITEPASGVTSRSDVLEDPLECEWSEHICPDGCKYYYNCVTCESRWEKPEEFALYEQQLRRRHLQKNHSMQELHPSTLKASIPEEDRDIQVAQDDQNESCDIEKPQLAISCAVEHTHGQVQTETSTLGGPAFVQ